MRSSNLISDKYLRFLSLKSDKVNASSIAESALIATSEANMNALRLEIPIVYLENQKLIEFYPNGTKLILGEIKKSKHKLKKHFKI